MPNRYVFDHFAPCEDGNTPLRLESFERRKPGRGEVEFAPAALSLNFRDLLILSGSYNPKLPLPATPISDAAGIVTAVGEGVRDIRVGDRMITNFVSQWENGPFRAEYLRTTLGTPAAGLASQYQYLQPQALVPMPKALDFAAASTLPIAALTAWSALIVEGECKPGQKVLTLGTGGVSIFALQLGRALGLEVAITSSSDAKLARCRELGATCTINYAEDPNWGATAAKWAGGEGVDLVVETGGIGTIGQSLRAVRAGGRLAILGVLSGMQGSIDLGSILMRRVQLRGIMVDSREHLHDMLRFLDEYPIAPVISNRFSFAQLPEALCAMQRKEHFGKIVIEMPAIES